MVQYQVIKGLICFHGFDHWERHLQAMQQSPCVQQLLLVFLGLHKAACSHHATCLDPGVAQLYQWLQDLPWFDLILFHRALLRYVSIEGYDYIRWLNALVNSLK